MAPPSPAVTGKPIQLGGSLGREKATGRGVFVTGRKLPVAPVSKSEGAKVALQGFGNVGSEAARLFAGVGARIVVIQDHTATLYNEGGIDMVALTARRRRKQIAGSRAPVRSIKTPSGPPDGHPDPGGAGRANHRERAEKLTCKLVLKGPTAQPIRKRTTLAERGVIVVPDVICNAGVTVSHFEGTGHGQLLERRGDQRQDGTAL